jgi:membrane-associated protease RseP (regulator of RpoE activity)
MFGGPLVNLILAIFLFTVVLTGIGMPTATTTVSEVLPCVPTAGASECAATDPASPASLAGMQPGDTITAVNGDEVTAWEQITTVVAANPGTPVTVTVDRAGEAVDLQVTPASYDRPQYNDANEPLTNADGTPVTKTVGYMGVVPTAELASQPVTAGIALTGTYLQQTVKVVATLPVALYHVSMAALGQEDRSTSGVVGIVGVGRIAADVASANVEGYDMQLRIADMLMLLAGLNLALFVFNMIPLVPLDGGHIASALWQSIKNNWARLRKLPKPAPVDVARMMPLAYGVFGLLVIMGGILIWADIVAPVTYG